MNTYSCNSCKKSISTAEYLFGDALKCWCKPAKKMILSKAPPAPAGGAGAGAGAATPTVDLETEFKPMKAYTERVAICAVLNVTNKAHKPHGSNASFSQNRKALILDIVAPIKDDAEWERVRKLVQKHYGFDITLG